MRVLKSAKLGVILVFLFVLFCLPTKKISAQIYSSYSYYPHYYYRSYYQSYYRYRYQTAYNYVRHNYPFHKRWNQIKERRKESYSKTNLLYQIKSSNSVKRKEAVDLIKRFSQDSEVKKALEEILDDPNPEIRKNAIKALLGSKDSYPLQQTVKRLGDFPSSDSQQTVSILARVLCSARDSAAREEAARSLGKLKNPGVLSVLKIAERREINIRVQEEIKNSIIKMDVSQEKDKKEIKEEVKSLDEFKDKTVPSLADTILKRDPNISYEEFKKKLGWD